MRYKLFNAEGREIRNRDLQDKGKWCRKGEALEEAFLAEYGAKQKLRLNPKKSTDPTAIDFVFGKGMPADLKTQNTPFFKAEELYGISPQYAVTFNLKDAEYYWKKYRKVLLYFWVDWMATAIEFSGGRRIEVKPMSGVWGIRFMNLTELLGAKNLHTYAQRKGDKGGNARDSYVVDLQNPHFTRLTGG
jgi:hypothetical protein